MKRSKRFILASLILGLNTSALAEVHDACIEKANAEMQKGDDTSVWHERVANCMKRRDRRIERINKRKARQLEKLEEMGFAQKESQNDFYGEESKHVAECRAKVGKLNTEEDHRKMAACLGDAEPGARKNQRKIAKKKAKVERLRKRADLKDQKIALLEGKKLEETKLKTGEKSSPKKKTDDSNNEKRQSKESIDEELVSTIAATPNYMGTFLQATQAMITLTQTNGWDKAIYAQQYNTPLYGGLPSAQLISDPYQEYNQVNVSGAEGMPGITFPGQQ